MFVHSSPAKDDVYNLYNYQVTIRDHYPSEVTTWVNQTNIFEWLSKNVDVDEYSYSWIENQSQTSLIISFTFKTDLDILMNKFIFRK